MMHSENEGAAEDTEEEIEEEAEEESEDDGKVEFEQLTNSCNNKTFKKNKAFDEDLPAVIKKKPRCKKSRDKFSLLYIIPIQ